MTFNITREEWFLDKARNLKKQLDEQEVEKARQQAEARANKNNPNPKPQEQIVTQSPINKDGFIYVPSINLYLSEETHFKGKDWKESHIETQKQGCTMPTIQQFVEFLRYLRSDEGKAKVKNADKILNEIYEVRNPWRSEWLDAYYFEQKAEDMLVNYNHKFNGTSLIAQNTEQLTNYLAETKIPGISLEDWLENPNPHGLPKSNCKDGKLCYWQPENGRVARFYADSGRAILGCDGVPDVRYDSLRVRLVASAENASQISQGGNSK